MPPLGLPLRRKWVGQRSQGDPVALAAVKDRLDDVGGGHCQSKRTSWAKARNGISGRDAPPQKTSKSISLL